MKSLLVNYKTESFYDEMLTPDGDVRPSYKLLLNKLEELGIEDLKAKQHTAEKAYVSMGITFNVYHEGQGIERTLPFDLLPRIIPYEEWDIINRGLLQRVFAINAFLDDVYNKKLVLKDKVVPKEIVESSPGYLRACEGIRPPKGRWAHISGIDLIKHADGQFYVLEDNCRVPSGVSYVLGNREIMKRAFPAIFEQVHVRPIYDYPLKLREMLEYLSNAQSPRVVVLTPGIYNSAYFEHAFLAQQMGAELVEGKDLLVENGFCYMRTTKGLEQVDVIYRRVDDEFLDPKVFRKDSVLGVEGLFDAYRRGNVAIANAPGTGVADDKVVYAFMPEIIKYYLDEEPVLPNVPTYLCWRPKDCKYVIENIGKMVVKMANQSGGYGMLMGPSSTEEERKMFITNIQKNPRDYIAQPVMSLSRVPTLIGNDLEGRHVDLRPFVLFANSPSVMPGGLSRVALKKGSLIVNSSQGGGSKDTWVLSQPESEIYHA
ncbi:MAG: circularly permuted type 2 ATP-grasp protein [Candidatus Omnitrophica bacterium]|nr:circularly permuted type 2 ATP-grasp protein [Candidatus Omnitrophota bacterium]